MSKWFGLGAVVLIALIITGSYIQGYYHAKAEAAIDNAKANEAQEEERRETNAAVNRLDNTGLRDAILRGNGKSK